MFKKLISILYIYYSKSPFEDAYNAAILLFVAIQQLWFFVLLEFAERLSGKESILTNNRYYFIPVAIIWAWIFFKLYPKNKVLEYVEAFKLEPKFNRNCWAVMSICLLAIPLLIIFFYF